MSLNMNVENQWEDIAIMIQNLLPYITSVICALISGFASYFVARKKAKADMNTLEKQFSLDIEKEREKFRMEKEKMEIEYKYQMELKQKELDSALNNTMLTSVMAEAMKNPDIQRQIQNGISSGVRHKGKRKQ